MNDPSPRRGSEKTSGRRHSESSHEYGRLVPRLVLTAELEELPSAQMVAETYEGQTELVLWLTRTSVRRRLHEHLDDVLDALRDAA